MTSHRHIHEVRIAEVYLGNATGTLHHDWVVLRGKSVECLADGMTKFLTTFLPEIIVSRTIADRASVENDLSSVLGVRFQQKGIHVGVARNACRLGLYRLGTAISKPSFVT